MRNPPDEPPSLRIAVLWQPSPFQAQRILNAVYRRAALEPGGTLRQFDPFQADGWSNVAQQLLDWQPHGVVLRMSDPKLLAKLRQLLPGIPMVAALVLPPGLVDTSVGMDAAEAITICRDHFRSRGLSHIAYFYSSVPESAHTRSGPFHVAVPDGHFMGIAFKEKSGIRGLPATPPGKRRATTGSGIAERRRLRSGGLKPR